MPTCGRKQRSIAYLMSAVLAVRFWSGALYLIPDRIFTVIVLPPFEAAGSPVARSGVGVVSFGFHPYNQRWVVWPSDL